MYFDHYNPNPMSIAVGRVWKTPKIRKKLNFPDYRKFPVLDHGNGYRIFILQLKIILNRSIRSVKFSLSQGNHGRQSKVTYNYGKKKKGFKTAQNEAYFFKLASVVLWPAKSKTNFHFRRPEPENPDNLVKPKIYRIMEGFRI